MDRPSSQHPAAAARSSAEGAAADPLRAGAARLGTLRAAVAALAPCGGDLLEVQRLEQAAVARVLRLGRQSAARSDADAEELSAELDALGRALREATHRVPEAALHSKLPASLESNRDGLLALLDLLAVEAYSQPGSLESKLVALDALITLLCTEGDAKSCVAPADPVSLTPTLKRLCEAAQAENPVNLAELEAAFFTAANLATDLCDQGPLRELGARKAELGRAYFVPGMLRAIVTYNMALLQCLEPEAWDGRPGAARPGAVPQPDRSSTSVFDSELLAGLHVALQRRLSRAPARPDPIHRIAWGLDLDDLSARDLQALRAGRLDASDLTVAVLLVGLLCRSIEVIAIELQEIGVDPDHVAQHWVQELDTRVKEEVSGSIAGVVSEKMAYERACALSKLRNQHLVRSGARPGRGTSAQARAARQDFEERKVRRQARSLATEAVAGREADRPATLARWAPLARPSATVLGGLAASIALAWLVLGSGWLQRDLERWNPRELAAVSEHLVAGHRNGAGSGPAFVGTLAEGWVALSPEERQLVAHELVEALREQGVSQVMIYDTDRSLRIQALGGTLRAH